MSAPRFAPRRALRLRLVALPALVFAAGTLFIFFQPAPPPTPFRSAPAPADFVSSAATVPAPEPTPPTSPAPAIPAPTLASLLSLADSGDHAAAASLTPNLPEGDQLPALASIFSAWAAHDLAAATSAALAIGTDSHRDTAWRAVAAAWAETDPAGLAAFARELPSGPARHVALEHSVRRWLDLDAPAALAWVETLPSSPESDIAVALVARHPSLLSTQPELALAWAEALRDPAQRSRTLGHVVRAWREIAPAAAEHYARSSPDLTDSEREDILVGERFTAHP